MCEYCTVHFPIDKITELSALIRSITVHILYAYIAYTLAGLAGCWRVLAMLAGPILRQCAVPSGHGGVYMYIPHCHSGAATLYSTAMM